MIAKTLITPESESLPLFIGIDVAKNSHVAAFVSSELLKKHRRFESCPVLAFENSRSGFESLVQAMQFYAPLSECSVVLERTGHYHKAIEQYLLDAGIAVYELHVQERLSRIKSDPRDAQSLANLLYNQIALRVQVSESAQIARPALRKSETANLLRGLVRRRLELVREIAQRKNQLTAIVDEVFPEFAQVFKNPTCESALNIRSRFASREELAEASIGELLACCTGVKPGRAGLLRLQELARESIGTRDPARRSSMHLEKKQLIAELRLLTEHIEELDSRIGEIISSTREGQILTSIPGISEIAAATILASIGSIANFESAAKLRAFFGWSPDQRQTGTTLDSMPLTKGGNRTIKQTMYLAAWLAVRHDSEWRDLYLRLVPRICRYDERLGRYRGKNKVLGRIIGQLIGVVYTLLRKDYELLASLQPGETPPPPVCYDRAVHHAHRMRHCH